MTVFRRLKSYPKFPRGQKAWEVWEVWEVKKPHGDRRSGLLLLLSIYQVLKRVREKSIPAPLHFPSHFPSQKVMGSPRGKTFLVQHCSA